MRVSVRANDAGYRRDASGGTYHVTLDGRRVKRCVTADSGRGYVVKVAFRNCRYILDGNDVRTVRIFGDVQIYRNGELLA